MKGKWLVSVAISVGVLFFSHQAHALDSTNEYIVMFHQKIDDNALKKMNVKVVKRYHLIPAVLVKSKPSVIQSTLKQPGVETVEKDVKVSSVASLTDSSVDQTNLNALNDLKIPELYNMGITGTGEKIAILDTGIDYTHPDLIKSNGQSVVIGGVSFVSSENVGYQDLNGHGTHVAGIIAAQHASQYGNADTTLGVASNASLLAVKVLDGTGSGYLSDVISGIEWAVDQKADVINMSLGFPSDYSSLQAAVDAADQSGTLVVAAAGNESDDTMNDSSPDNVLYPAKYPSVLSVAAADTTDPNFIIHAPFSSIGDEVDITAPGVDITSSYLNNGYASMDGTSMATPYVTGMVALYKEEYPTLSNAQIRQMIFANAEDLGTPGKDRLYGYGLIQPFSITPVSQPITFLDNGDLYTAPSSFSDSHIQIGPQTVQAFETVNGFYHIHTWLGDRWVSLNRAILGTVPETDVSVQIISKTPLYAAPYSDRKTTAFLNPGSYTSFENINGFYAVNTSSGIRWINPSSSEGFIGNFTPYNQSIYLSKTTKLYDSPSASSFSRGAVAPQMVTVDAMYSNGWYRISTYLGEQWIQPSSIIVGAETNANLKLTLTEKELLYQSPFNSGNTPIYIGPQTVTATAQWGNWFLINTWLGPKWILPSFCLTGDKVPVNMQITLTKNTILHSFPWSPAPSTQAIGPQTVTATAQWNNWYLINTWIGPLWIVPNQ